jgi:SAM-dependent methyltransferase
VTTEPVDIEEAWNALHSHDRFLPRYPSESVIRFLARRFERAHPALILDLGCGGGRHSAAITEMGHRAIGVDRSIVGLRHARAVIPAPVAVVQCTMTAIPLRDASVDGVVAFGVLLYGDQQTFDDACAEVRRVLAPGAWACIVTRTADDTRATLGPAVEPGTVLISDDSTNEGGMLMHFLDESGVDRLCEPFSTSSVDRIDHTAGGGALRNSDWVIEVRR